MPLYLIYHSLLDINYGLDECSKNENQIVIMRHECCKKEKTCYLYEKNMTGSESTVGIHV